MVSSFLRTLPPFKGKARLARLLLKDKGVVFYPQSIKGKYGLTYVIPNTKESIGFFLLINGIYEEDLSAYIIKSLPTNGVFLDIGINIGTISLPVASQRKDSTIIGVEAADNIFNCLKENIEINRLTNIHPHHNAVSDKDGEFVSFFSPEDQFGKGSMSAVFTKEEKRVETITLDNLLQKYQLTSADLIKVDVEGYEYNVFKGGGNLLSSHEAPDIIFEFVDWAENLAHGINIGDSQRILKGYGYTIFDFDNLKGGPLPEIVTKGMRNLYATKSV
jgi:FkbM family methyltransferase